MALVPIRNIIVGERRRQSVGDLRSLAESLLRVGLIHPIIVDADHMLVAGERRLRAAERIGWTTIEARYRRDLSPGEARALELEENLGRKDLTAHERSRVLVDLVAATQAVLREEGEFLPIAGKNSGPMGGRPVEPASEQAAAERVGVPQQTVNRAKQHVAAVAQVPELAAAPQAAAIAAASRLAAADPSVVASARADLRALPPAEARSGAAVAAAVAAAVRAAPPAAVGDLLAALSRAERAQARRRYSRALTQARAGILTVDPAAWLAVLDASEYDAVEQFLRDTLAWIDRVQAAVQECRRVREV